MMMQQINFQDINAGNIIFANGELNEAPQPLSICRMRQPINDLKNTEILRKIKHNIEKEPIKILQCCGVPGSGKSQIVRKLAAKFPFAVNENAERNENVIKWHIQCKDSGHLVVSELQKLAEELRKNNHIPCLDAFQSIYDDLSMGSTERLVNILIDSEFPVLIVIEDPHTNSCTNILRELFRCLENKASKFNYEEIKVHLYITSRTTEKILPVKEARSIQCYFQENVKGFNKQESVEFLIDECSANSVNEQAALKVYERFSGLPLGLQAAKAFCQNIIDYSEYLDLMDDIEYEIVQQEKENIVDEYGDSAQHVFQAIAMSFVPPNDSDSKAVLYWKILSCLAYFNYDRIPRKAIQYSCHLLREVQVKRPHEMNKLDAGRLINKLIDHHMCTETVEKDVTFHEVVLNAFRLNQHSFLRQSFNPLKKAIEIMAGLIAKDFRYPNRAHEMHKFRRHIQTLLGFVENNKEIFDDEESKHMLMALTSHLYDTSASAMMYESPAFAEECAVYFRKALDLIWSGQDLSIVQTDEKSEEIAKLVVDECQLKSKTLSSDFPINYVSKLLLIFDDKVINFLRSMSSSTEVFKDVEVMLKNHLYPNIDLIRKLQMCNLFLPNDIFSSMFYAERIASILSSWSRLASRAASDFPRYADRCMWMAQLSKNIAIECRNRFGANLLVERLSQTGGLLSILLKRKNVSDILDARKLKENLTASNDIAHCFENGLLVEVYGNSDPNSRISLLKYVTRVNTRLLKIKPEFVNIAEADNNCHELFDLALENVSKLTKSFLSIVYIAKYYAAKNDFIKSIECFDKFFEISPSQKQLTFNTICWAVYNYARAVCYQPCFERFMDAINKCENSLKANEIMDKNLNSNLKSVLSELKLQQSDAT